MSVEGREPFPHRDVRSVMGDLLADIFTDEIVARLGKGSLNSPSAEFRYRVLSLSQRPLPAVHSAIDDRQFCESTRRRWNRWIAAALSAGMFREPSGSELKSRLIGIDDDGFRSALAECMTCLALSRELGLPVLPRPSGRGGRVLECGVLTGQGEISFEVKSPRVLNSAYFGAAPGDPFPSANFYPAVLATRAALRSANRQFARACRNVLVLAFPQIEKAAPREARGDRPMLLIRAFYGERPSAAAPSGGSAKQFVAEGDFLKRPGGALRFTRISAVLGLQDRGCDSKMLRRCFIIRIRKNLWVHPYSVRGANLPHSMGRFDNCHTAS